MGKSVRPGGVKRHAPVTTPPNLFIIKTKPNPIVMWVVLQIVIQPVTQSQ